METEKHLGEVKFSGKKVQSHAALLLKSKSLKDCTLAVSKSHPASEAKSQPTRPQLPYLPPCPVLSQSWEWCLEEKVTDSRVILVLNEMAD